MLSCCCSLSLIKLIAIKVVLMNTSTVFSMFTSAKDTGDVECAMLHITSEYRKLVKPLRPQLTRENSVTELTEEPGQGPR